MALCGTLALAAAVIAIKVEPFESPAAQGAPRPTAALVTPVLSPRRVPALIAKPVADKRVSESLSDLWSRHSSASCLIVAEGNQVIYERMPEQLVTPASTMKLLTASVALSRLGPETRFLTTVKAMSRPKTGIIDGDLWLVGGGDPVLGTKDWADQRSHQPPLASSLEGLADRVVAAGVHEVRGKVLGDESRYDSVRSVASWPSRYLSDHEIGPLSALTVNDGFASWTPTVTPFTDPAAGAAEVFAALLSLRGVSISGGFGSATAPRSAPVLAQIESPTVADLVTDLIRESDNGTAELLVKELGFQSAGEGSTAAGLTVISQSIEKMGLATDGISLVDGSGLDPTNKLRCKTLQSLAASIESGGPIDRGLAIAGFSGTLTKRFLDSPAKGKLRAKTGSLNNVAALVGRVEGAKGTVLIFTQVNNDVAGLTTGRSLQEDLGAALARYPDLPPIELLSPLAPPKARP